MRPPSPASAGESSPEPWITKQRLAEHLSVTPRWIELQQRRGLPHIHTPGLNRYRISEVESWLREQYGWPQGQVDKLQRLAPRAPPFVLVRGCSQTYKKSGRRDSNSGPHRPESWGSVLIVVVNALQINGFARKMVC
jgi:hypothetical protein